MRSLITTKAVSRNRACSLAGVISIKLFNPAKLVTTTASGVSSRQARSMTAWLTAGLARL